MNFTSPKVNLEVFLKCLNVKLQVTKIGELNWWRIYFVWIDKLAFLKEGKVTYLTF